jgi:hypothetical protein
MRAHLLREKLRRFPGSEIAALINLVEVGAIEEPQRSSRRAQEITA